MLKDAKGFRRVVIACGRTDLRRGIDGLAAIVQEQFRMDPSEKNVLFLFCGTRLDRIKGLVFEGDGYTRSTKILSPYDSTDASCVRVLYSRSCSSNIGFSISFCCCIFNLFVV